MSSDEQRLSPEGRSRLRAVVNRTVELTPLKTAATRAIQMAEDEHSAAMDLATVISSDPALTAKLLRLANSAYYGYSRQISNVREAVILLGMRTVRSVAISSAIIDAFGGAQATEHFDPDLFWAHSVCVGLVAEAIARNMRGARPEDAFTAGVVHDIGKLAVMTCEPQLFDELNRMVVEDRVPYGQAELRVLGFGHEHAGSRLAERWKFPISLVDAIANHHSGTFTEDGRTLGDCVAAADFACNRAGLAAGYDWVRDESRRSDASLPPPYEEAISRIRGGIPALEEKARAFLTQVSAGPITWYLQSSEKAGDATTDSEASPIAA